MFDRGHDARVRRAAWVLLLVVGIAAALAPSAALASAPSAAPGAASAAAPAAAPAVAPVSAAALQLPDTARLGAFLRQQMERDGVPGLAVAVVRRDTLLYAAAFGEGGGRPVSLDGTFIIGSLSKAFTATAVMQLAQAGLVDLDAPVQAYLLEFDPGGVQGTVTLRHLLNQRSGFVRRQGFQEPGEGGQVSADKQFPPGTRFEYSNLNYALLGRVLERVSERPYGSYLQAEVFEPLGMESAEASPRISEDEHLVRGEQFLFWPTVALGEPEPQPASVPSGFIRATAEGMGAFLSAHLRADSTAGLGLSAEAFRPLHTPPGGGTGYAMGWSRRTWEGRAILTHDGMTAAYSSAMAILPDDDLGVVVLTNVNSFTASGHLRDGMLRLLFDLPVAAYSRTERWIRLGGAVLLFLSVVGFARSLRQWRHAGRPRRIAARPSVLGPLLLGVGFNLAVLICVPYFFAQMPLLSLIRLQPDIGLLFLGVPLGIAERFFSASLRTHRN